MSRNWRQVRVFTANVGPGWYHEILADIVVPWLAEVENTDYFFSKYLVPLGQDEADTDPHQLALQLQLLQQTNISTLHRSIRIRFVEPIVVSAAPASAVAPAPAGPRETSLQNRINALPLKYWISAFLPYALRNDLGGDRFSEIPVLNATGRDARGELVAGVLKANCQLVLSLFTVQGVNYAVEGNQHPLNQIIRTPVQSVAHMLANVWFNARGENVAIWALDHDRDIGSRI